MPMFRRKNDLDSLKRTLDKLPASLRAGPYFLYGMAAKQVGEHEMAILAWVRLPTEFPTQRPLCREALREAAGALDQLGRSDQAAALRQEAGLHEP